MHEPCLWPGGKPGEVVSAVKAADLKSAWAVAQEVQSYRPGEHVAIGIDAIERVCSSGADISAVTYRSTMLGMLLVLAGDRLAPWRDGALFHQVVFTVAARIPMTWMDVGVPQQGLPFDPDLFFQELQSAL
jgi:hypothetical protein